MVQPSTLQNKVEDVGHPQHVKHAGDAEQHHGVAFVRTAFAPLPSLTFVPLRLRAEASVALGDLSGVLPTDLEYTAVGVADGERRRCVQQPHNKGAEPRVGLPGVVAPLEYVPVVSWFPPAKERRQEDHSRVNPDEDDARSQPTRRHQRCIGQWAGYGDVAVDADARQRSHGDALQHRNHVAKSLASELLVKGSEIMEQGQRGYQTADSDQQIGISHSLDEVTGGVVVQQRGAVEDEDHHQVAGDDEHGEEEDDDHLQHTRIQAVRVTHGTQQAEWLRTTLVHIEGRVHVWIGGRWTCRGPL